MGDIADYYMDLAMQQEAEWEAERHFRIEASREMEKKYMMGILTWKTNDGDTFLVQDLSDAHLKNCISFLRKSEKDEVSSKWIEILGYETEKRR